MAIRHDDMPISATTADEQCLLKNFTDTFSELAGLLTKQRC